MDQMDGSCCAPGRGAFAPVPSESPMHTETAPERETAPETHAAAEPATADRA